MGSSHLCLSSQSCQKPTQWGLWFLCPSLEAAEETSAAGVGKIQPPRTWLRAHNVLQGTILVMGSQKSLPSDYQYCCLVVHLSVLQASSFPFPSSALSPPLTTSLTSSLAQVRDRVKPLEAAGEVREDAHQGHSGCHILHSGNSAWPQRFSS